MASSSKYANQRRSQRHSELPLAAINTTLRHCTESRRRIFPLGMALFLPHSKLIHFACKSFARIVVLVILAKLKPENNQRKLGEHHGYLLAQIKSFQSFKIVVSPFLSGVDNRAFLKANPHTPPRGSRPESY